MPGLQDALIDTINRRIDKHLASVGMVDHAMGRHFVWESGFDRNLILRRFSACRRINNGRAAFTAHEYKFWFPILLTAIRAKTPEGMTLKVRCVRKAMNDPELKLNDPDKFIARCEAAFREASRQTKQPFIFVCDITYTGPRLFNSIRDGDCRIVWSSRSSRFLSAAYKARDELSHILADRDVSTNFDGLTPILVHVNALDYESAIEQAIVLVDRLRGIFNLVVNAKRKLNILSELTKPHAVNRFRLGPCRTLHRPDGSLAVKMFWYEPRWSHDLKSVEFKGEIKATKGTFLRWWKRAQHNPLRGLITGGLLRYCRALDQHDLDSTLLGLWGALELLTGTQNATYENTVDRITHLFKDPIEVRQIAQHIRLRRNSTVHAAQSPSHEEIETIIWQAEFLVSQILFFCIREGRTISKQPDLRFFLDLTLEEDVLRRQKVLIGKFLDYRRRVSSGG